MNIRCRAAVIVAATVAVATGSVSAAHAMPASQLGRAAPYQYLGWGNPQPVTQVMAATGIRQLTLAFMLSDGTCNPAWDDR